MKSNIFIDINTAVDVFKSARRARKEGKEVKIVQMQEIPCVKPSPAFLNTVEGCTLVNHDKEIFNIAFDAFHRLSYEEGHRLEFAPKNREFIRRVNLWKSILKPVMTEKQYRIAMGLLLHRYIYIKKLQVCEGR